MPVGDTSAAIDRPPFGTSGVSHSEDEDSLALVARADFRRSEQSALNREAQLAKVSPYPLGSSDFIIPRREHSADVFDEDEPRARRCDDASGVRPEVASVELSALSAGKAVWLARDAANEAIHKAAPRSAVEGSGIAPHSGLSHETLFHRCHQVRDGEGFPLHHNDAASAGNCQLDSKVETAASGAEGEDIEALGMNSHIHGIPTTGNAANHSTAAANSP